MSLLSSIWPYLAMAGAALVAFLGYGIQQRSAGRKEQVAKQAAADAKARREADEIQNDVGAMPPDKRREELRKWSK